MFMRFFLFNMMMSNTILASAIRISQRKQFRRDGKSIQIDLDLYFKNIMELQTKQLCNAKVKILYNLRSVPDQVNELKFSRTKSCNVSTTTCDSVTFYQWNETCTKGDLQCSRN